MHRRLSLPQYSASNNQQRQDELADMRKLYAFSMTYDGYIATINKLPAREKAGFYYQSHAACNLLGLIPSVPSIIAKWVKHKVLKKPFTQYEDYLFYKNSPVPNPQMWKNFQRDQYLGYQRVAGMNPVVLEGVTEENPLPDTFEVHADVLGISEEKWAFLQQDKRLYMTNYSMLLPLQENPGEVDGKRKYVMPLIALYEMKDDGHLQILAAQLDATKHTDSENNPIITPEDKCWPMVRVYIQAADGTHQELWTHATRIHYVLESVIMVTWRQLSQSHPLLALLKPHLKYTLSVNVNPLFEPAPDGSIPEFGKMFACNNDALVAFMAQGMKSYSFKEFIFPKELENRHVTDERLFYPYRDDGLPIWREIKRFVEEYLALWYKVPADVQQDTELQAWAAELGGRRDEGKCNLTDFPTEFTNVEQLVDIATHILWISTAHHSAVHYPQYECAGYAPNLPFSGYVPPYTDPEHYQDEEGLTQFFPPYDMAYQQSWIFYLTNFKVNHMGDYPLEDFDRDGIAVIKTHQNNLNAIHQQVVARNKERKFPYIYMDPKTVPNSVTV